MCYCNALIVDDDVFQMHFLSELMQEIKVNYKAYSVQKAIEHLHEAKIDIVISDLVMPERVGLHLLEKIGEIHDEIPFVMVIGYAQVSGAVAFMKSGTPGYVTKAYTHDVLKRCLSEAVKNKVLANGHDAAKGILVGLSSSIIIWSFIVSGIVSIFSI